MYDGFTDVDRFIPFTSPARGAAEDLPGGWRLAVLLSYPSGRLSDALVDSITALTSRGAFPARNVTRSENRVVSLRNARPLGFIVVSGKIPRKQANFEEPILKILKRTNDLHYFLDTGGSIS